MNMALLVIDMQKVSYRGHDKDSMDRAAGCINHAAELFRKHGKKVIWIQDENKNSGAVRGTGGFEIIDALQVKEDDKIFTKEYYNAFNKTGLYEYLAREKADTVIITGYCAEYCVLSTYRGAVDKDLRPVLLKNAIAGGSKKRIRFVEDMCDILTLNLLEEMLRYTGTAVPG